MLNNQNRSSISTMLWLAGAAYLSWLAFNELPPGCYSSRDEQGNAIVIACRFAGATLGPALLLLAAVLPFLVLMILESTRTFAPSRLLAGIFFLIAWLAYVRFDLLQLWPEGVAWLLTRCWLLYSATFAVSALAAIVCSRGKFGLSIFSNRVT